MSNDKADFQGSVVRVADLTVTSSSISGKVFRDCLILGPAVAVLSGKGALDGCTFDAPPEALLWPITDGRKFVVGAVEFKDCFFYQCRFQNVGLAGDKQFAKNFTENLAPSSEEEATA
ncbi:hypothetical protein [Arthrobacter sp.]|uniref:hypothetical protein n=1 Tax=Arthrobacter sp. TaxID=1667 RepID=UPI003A91DACB